MKFVKRKVRRNFDIKLEVSTGKPFFRKILFEFFKFLIFFFLSLFCVSVKHFIIYKQLKMNISTYYSIEIHIENS